MKFTHGGILLALWLASGTASAAGIECSAEGGRIVDSQAAVVWVAMDDTLLAVTDDPEAQAAMAAAGGAPVMSPDDFCLHGWVLPAPHPGDPLPAPLPAGGVLPATPRPVIRLLRTPPVEVDAPTSAQSGAPEAAAPATSAPPGTAAVEPVVVVAAADEPTPTPATPAPTMETRSLSAEGCSNTGGASSALWSLLLLAGLRRRRGGR